MDEIDAALDFKNVSIVANYINVSCKPFHADLFTYLTLNTGTHQERTIHHHFIAF